MEKIVFLALLLSFPFFISAFVFGGIWLVFRRNIVWKLFLGLWLVFLLTLGGGYIFSYFTPPRDKVYQYTNIRLSNESIILRKFYNLKSMDYGCAFEIQLSASDYLQLRNFFTFHARGGAIERLPKSWNVTLTKNLESFENNRHGVWIYCDFDPVTRMAWLVIQTT